VALERWSDLHGSGDSILTTLESVSHALFVHGRDPAFVDELRQRGVALFSLFHRLTPVATHSRVGSSVTVFPSLLSSAPHILATDDGCACGVGTWFYDGTIGAEALKRLSRAAACDTTLRELSLDTLDGWFAVLLFTDDDAELITDRLGEFHMYASSIDGHTVVSTSSMVLAALTRAAWDLDGCRQFLAVGWIVEPSRTLFRGVTKLAPASRYRFCNGALRAVTRYWSVASVAWPAMAPPGNATVLASELRTAVSTVLRNFPRPVFDLTGGVDTRGLLGATLQLGATVDFVVNGDASDPDVVASLRLARAFGFDMFMPRVPPRARLSCGTEPRRPCRSATVNRTFCTTRRRSRLTDCSPKGSTPRSTAWQVKCPMDSGGSCSFRSHARVGSTHVSSRSVASSETTRPLGCSTTSSGKISRINWRTSSRTSIRT
jgi:hypothetical protein